MPKEKRSCTKCGRKQARFFLWMPSFDLYACQAPGCSEHGKYICWYCLKKMGVEQNYLGDFKEDCPTCKFGYFKRYDTMF